jgi:deoxyadenosine/deoxycytidine kinase
MWLTYLDDFYHQMERWSFNLQIYFWIVVFVRWFKFESGKSHQDRTIYEDAHILPQSLFYGIDDQSWFSELFQSFELMESTVKAWFINLFKKLYSQFSWTNSQTRSRVWIHNSIDYLSRLNERYGGFLRDRGKILIDVDNINFVDKPEDWEHYHQNRCGNKRILDRKSLKWIIKSYSKLSWSQWKLIHIHNIKITICREKNCVSKILIKEALIFTF